MRQKRAQGVYRNAFPRFDSSAVQPYNFADKPRPRKRERFQVGTFPASLGVRIVKLLISLCVYAVGSPGTDGSAKTFPGMLHTQVPYVKLRPRIAARLLQNSEQLADDLATWNDPELLAA